MHNEKSIYNFKEYNFLKFFFSRKKNTFDVNLNYLFIRQAIIYMSLEVVMRIRRYNKVISFHYIINQTIYLLTYSLINPNEVLKIKQFSFLKTHVNCKLSYESCQ